MTGNHTEHTRRIAKNTILLYFRMFFLMVINVYASRVILAALGVEDYGIYNVVGGVVSMFTILSGSMSSAISRFITYEIGRNEGMERLKTVFATSVSVMLMLSVIIIAVAEVLGIWFIDFKMNVPPERLPACRYVFQFSLATFLVNLVSIPYNALIIAREKMSAYAYISIIEGALKLGIAFLICKSPIDRLIFYAILSFVLALVVRCSYTVYCRFHFEEVRHRIEFDSSLFRKMFSFAGWNFIGNGVYIVNTQGLNLLSNIFFGVTVNAARGIVSQVESAISQFVSNFTTAINPQITKSYAAGDMEYMFSLVCNGAKYSYFMMLFFAVPFVVEAEMILSLWLKNVPEYSVIFLRLATACSLCTVLSNTMVTAMFAYGDIRRYQITVGSIGLLAFPLCYILFKAGFPPYTAYVVYFLIYALLLVVRLFLLRDMLGMPVSMYLKRVIVRVIPVTLSSFAIPYLLRSLMQPSAFRVLVVTGGSLLAVLLSVWVFGVDKGERMIVINRLKTFGKCR